MNFQLASSFSWLVYSKCKATEHYQEKRQRRLTRMSPLRSKPGSMVMQMLVWLSPCTLLWTPDTGHLLGPRLASTNRPRLNRSPSPPLGFTRPQWVIYEVRVMVPLEKGCLTAPDEMGQWRGWLGARDAISGGRTGTNGGSAMIKGWERNTDRVWGREMWKMGWRQTKAPSENTKDGMGHSGLWSISLIHCSLSPLCLFSVIFYNNFQ